MGKKPIEKAYVHDEGWYAAHDVDLRTDTEVVAIDRDAKVVRTTDGAEQPYDQLVIATGRCPAPGPRRWLGCAHGIPADHRGQRSDP